MTYPFVTVIFPLIGLKTKLPLTMVTQMLVKCGTYLKIGECI